MKTELSLDTEFVSKYCFLCTSWQTVYRVTSSSESKMSHLWPEVSKALIRETSRVILNEYPGNPNLSLVWASDICKVYEINSENVNTLAFLFEVYRNKPEWNNKLTKQGFFDDDPLEYKQLHELLNNFKKDKSYIQKISFHLKGEKSIHFNGYWPIQMILLFLSNGYGDLNVKYYQEHNLKKLKKSKSFDIKLFSWALLNYLNQFTQYKSGENVLATNSQCKIIYKILKDANLLSKRPDDDIDDVKYVYAYLRQASVTF